MLYGLTPRSADLVRRRVLEAGGDLGGRTPTVPATRGVTWVKVTGALAGGWYPGVVTLDLDGVFSDLTDPVKVVDAAGAALVSGSRYLCTRTGDDPGTGQPRFRTVVDTLSAAAPVYGIASEATLHTLSGTPTVLVTASLAAGTYLLLAHVEVQVGAAVAGAFSKTVQADLWNGSGVLAPVMTPASVRAGGTLATDHMCTSSCSVVVTLGGTTTVSLRAYTTNFAGGDFATTFGNGGCRMTWLKL